MTVVLVCCCAVRLNTGSLLGSVLLAWGLGCGLSCCKPTTRIEETHSAVMVWPCGMWGCCPVSAASPGQATQPLWASVSSHVQGGLHSFLIPKSKKFQKTKKCFLSLTRKLLVAESGLKRPVTVCASVIQCPRVLTPLLQMQECVCKPKNPETRGPKVLDKGLWCEVAPSVGLWRFGESMEDAWTVLPGSP